MPLCQKLNKPSFCDLPAPLTLGGRLVPFLCVTLWQLRPKLGSLRGGEIALLPTSPCRFLQPPSISPPYSGSESSLLPPSSAWALLQLSLLGGLRFWTPHTPQAFVPSSGSIHHGNHHGSSPPHPRWSLRLGPHGATLDHAVCFPVLLFTVTAEPACGMIPRGFLQRGVTPHIW